ncbi:hypothetical protein LBBP_02216 [Leptospira borgpetersenii serovar Ballum]|uniref:Uncharacterized protein n=1 Tax=Leptospira borgpetersenii serovar Ballum TaxID=280505 RepID=A0A0S2IS83_LEPBO|nr:hypothetical protein LBBP_02216 [Leptospira borgpetersenii serovar Ballum]
MLARLDSLELFYTEPMLFYIFIIFYADFLFSADVFDSFFGM